MDTLIRQTESGIILDYLKWQVLHSLSIHMSMKYREISFKFQEKIYGIKSQPSRWKTCVSRTNSAVGFALGHLYVQETFSGESKDTALEMINDIRKRIMQPSPRYKFLISLSLSLPLFFFFFLLLFKYYVRYRI